MVNNIDELCNNFTSRKAKIGILGLGYVGLPLALAACEKGFQVYGFDVDTSKVDKLNAGESYIGNIPNDKISKVVKDGLFHAVKGFEDLANMDAVIICVPTPLNKNREPDMSYIENSAKTISKYLRKGQLISLESTTYPGTTDEVTRPILENATGLKSGVDFFLAFSPEREDPGNPVYHTAIIPKVIGGDGEAALRIAKTMYDQFLVATVPVSSTQTAEAVKITENIFRCINIALVNELKIIYDRMGIDIWEVVNAASTKPFGYMPFYPGPGLGGHCIPIDPFYLTWKAHALNVNTKFIELAGEINGAMPEYVVAKLAEALDLRFAKAMNGAKILVLGIAYKKNVSDDRESPSYMVMENLQKRKSQITYHDPFVAVIPNKREHQEFSGMKSVTLTPALLKEVDAVIIVTNHDDVDYQMVSENAKLIVDTRNAMAKIEKRDNIVLA